MRARVTVYFVLAISILRQFLLQLQLFAIGVLAGVSNLSKDVLQLISKFVPASGIGHLVNDVLQLIS
jgi:hypothetical protein